MDYKEKALKDVNDVFSSGDSKIHLMKVVMYFKHCEENLMNLSNSRHDDFISIIPIITDTIISDFKKYLDVISKSSDEFERFLVLRQKMFDKKNRFCVHLSKDDFDLIMDPLDEEYKKLIGSEKTETPSAPINNKSQKEEGCYVATMVYGDYDHPNVIELRKLRDNTLRKSVLGIWFVKFYYTHSPVFVQKFKNKKLINLFIKKALDRLIIIIRMTKN